MALRPLRTLLVDLPFQAVSRPNIGLSLLRATLIKRGFDCSIQYRSLDFAKQIGVENYTAIAELMPHELLFGDLVFALQVNRNWPDAAALQSLSQLVLKAVGQTRDLRRLWDQVPGFMAAADTFISHLADELVERDFDIFGFNLMFQCLPSVALAKAIKERSPGKVVVFGGANCEGPMGLALHRAYNWIDFVCRGEGELLIGDLVASLSGEAQPKEAIEGLVWRKKGESIANGQRAKLHDDLGQLPQVSYDDWVEQLHLSGMTHEVGRLSVPLETSRGCWYGQRNHCIFCGLNGESLAFRRKTPTRTLQEIDDLVRYNIKNVYAVDLIFPNDYFESVLPALIEKRLPLTFFYEVKANLVKSQLQQFHRARINQIQPGIESLNSRILRILNKGVFAYQNIRLLKWAAELGIGVEWNMLIDVPGASAEDYRAMVEIIPLIMHFRPPTEGCSRVRIDRFSPLHFRAKDFGLEDLRPAPAYRAVYDLPENVLQDSAYFFEASVCKATKLVEKSIGELQEAVAQWRASFGQETFFELNPTENETLLCDHRAAAITTTARLTGASAQVYRACAEGSSLEQILKKTKVNSETAIVELDRFLQNRWVIRIDDRYLSLSTVLDHVLGRDEFPDSALGEIGHAIQRARMRSLLSSESLPVVERQNNFA